MRSLLPFLFILVCPVMMLFMMRGMGHGSHRQHGREVVDAEGTVRSDQSAGMLADERSRLQEKLAQLDAQIEAQANAPGGVRDATQAHPALHS